MHYSSHATDIVGYTYQADIWCDACIREVAIRKACEAGDATIWGDCGTAEQTLGAWASADAIDRQDERSYDTADFPKVIFADAAHDGCFADNGYEPGQCGDRCGQCGEPIGFDCPNIPTDD
jgi:hypothetical protein